MKKPPGCCAACLRIEGRGTLIKPLNDPMLGPGHMRVTTAWHEDNKRFVEALPEVLCHA